MPVISSASGGGTSVGWPNMAEQTQLRPTTSMICFVSSCAHFTSPQTPCAEVGSVAAHVPGSRHPVTLARATISAAPCRCLGTAPLPGHRAAASDGPCDSGAWQGCYSISSACV